MATYSSRFIIALLALLAVSVACTAARSIEELYRVEVGPEDTVKAALNPESKKRPGKESESNEDSDPNSSEEEMSAAIIACVSVGVVLVCAAAVGVFACCLFGWCCFRRTKMEGRRHSDVVVTSSITTTRTLTETEKGAAARAALNVPAGATQASPTSTQIQAPPSYEASNERPPKYADIVFVPSAPADEPAAMHIAKTHVIVLNGDKGLQ